jgi:hypothetical protein
MLANLALPSIAMVEPLQEAFLVDILDTATTGTRMVQGRIGLAGGSTDSANIFFIIGITIRYLIPITRDFTPAPVVSFLVH